MLRHVRRGLYDLRACVPGMRFHHQCEKMIGPVGYWKELQQYQMNVLLANGLQPCHTLLDVGCGPLQGGIAFIRHLNAGNYTGVDIAPGNVQAACRQVIRHDLTPKNPRIIQSANYGAEYLAGAEFDFIWISQLLYLFDEKQMRDLMGFVSRHLSPGGKFLGDIVNPEKQAAVSAHYSGFLPHTLEFMQRAAASGGLQMRSLGEIIQYQYPARLTLNRSLMLEFTKAPRDEPTRSTPDSDRNRAAERDPFSRRAVVEGSQPFV